MEISVLPIEQNEIDTDHGSFHHFRPTTYQDHSMLRGLRIWRVRLGFKGCIRMSPRNLWCRGLFARSWRQVGPINKVFLFPIRTWKSILVGLYRLRHFSLKDSGIWLVCLHYGNYHILNNLLSISHKFGHQSSQTHSYQASLDKSSPQHHYTTQTKTHVNEHKLSNSQSQTET